MIIWKNDQTMSEVGFETEANLQEIIRDNPKLLSVISELNGQNYPLCVLKRECGVVSGSIDILAVDIEGGLYIIETKLAKNPEQKREVIAQVLDYASGLDSLPYESFSKLMRVENKPVEEYVHDYYSKREDIPIDGLPSKHEFKKKIEENLTKGNFNFVVVVNRIRDRGLISLIEYMNKITKENVNFLIMEIRKYQSKDKDKEMYQSNIVWAEKYVKKIQAKSKIDEAKFIDSKPQNIQEQIKYVSGECEKKHLVKTVNSQGLSWKRDDGGSIFITGNTLQTNWSTIRGTAGELADFKKQVMKKASQAGIQTISTKYGRIVLELQDQLLDEVKGKLNTFIDLAYSVMQKASEIEQQQLQASEVF